MDVGLRVRGVEELNRALRELAGDVAQAAETGAYAGGLVIEGKAKENTPVEYGNLQGSGYTKRIPKGAQVGFTSEYALFVHENMEQKLKGLPRPSGLGTYWNPGGPKFLERAVNENIAEVVDIMTAYIRRKLPNA